MKHRCQMHNYRERGIYMLTLATEGRQPLLGTLAGRADAMNGGDMPHVVLSALGKCVEECWERIHEFHPEVECLKLCIMPDHIHGILFVHERMEKHLGNVVEGFKTGTRKAARELGLLPTALVAQHTGQEDTEKTVIADNICPKVTCSALPAQSQSTPSRHTSAARAHGKLWEPGYNDRLLLHRGQLQRMMTYLDDNPRRLLIKREHPEYFRQLGTLTINGIAMQAMGNRFLLDNPTKYQVQCSRNLTDAEIKKQKTTLLETALNNGAVLISPCISLGEQQITTAAMNAHIPLIVLLLKGFPPYFKPQPRYLEACREGRLLMLAPFPWQSEKIENMRQRCLYLNSLAAHICDSTH